MALVLSYWGANPYHVARRFAEWQGEKEVYTYGETPLTTLDAITREYGLTKDDVVFELGCGRGRSCFWLGTILGCKTIGIDYNPYFIGIATKITKKYGMEQLEFRCEDILHTDLTGATVIYLYGSAYEDEFIERLAS